MHTIYILFTLLLLIVYFFSFYFLLILYFFVFSLSSKTEEKNASNSLFGMYKQGIDDSDSDQEIMAQDKVFQAIFMLQRKEVLGRVQDSQAGLGWWQPALFWCKVTREQAKTMVVEGVSQFVRLHQVLPVQHWQCTYPTQPVQGAVLQLAQGRFRWWHSEVWVSHSLDCNLPNIAFIKLGKVIWKTAAGCSTPLLTSGHAASLSN